MAILISCVFGLTSFCLIVALCIRSLKPVQSPATRQNVVEISGTSVAAPGAPPQIDGAGEFLRITATCELKFPKVAFRLDNPASLPFGAPLQQGFRPLSMQGQGSSPFVAGQVENIAHAR